MAPPPLTRLPRKRPAGRTPLQPQVRDCNLHTPATHGNDPATGGAPQPSNDTKASGSPTECSEAVSRRLLLSLSFRMIQRENPCPMTVPLGTKLFLITYRHACVFKLSLKALSSLQLRLTPNRVKAPFFPFNFAFRRAAGAFHIPRKPASYLRPCIISHRCL